MMPAETILTEARRAGLRLWRAGDNLAVAPAHLCPPELAARIRAAKPSLLALLAAEAAPATALRVHVEDWFPGELDAPHLAGWDRHRRAIYQGTEREWRARFRHACGRWGHRRNRP